MAFDLQWTEAVNVPLDFMMICWEQPESISHAEMDPRMRPRLVQRIGPAEYITEQLQRSPVGPVTVHVKTHVQRPDQVTQVFLNPVVHGTRRELKFSPLANDQVSVSCHFHVTIPEGFVWMIGGKGGVEKLVRQVDNQFYKSLQNHYRTANPSIG